MTRPNIIEVTVETATGTPDAVVEAKLRRAVLAAIDERPDMRLIRVTHGDPGKMTLEMEKRI